MGVRQQTTEPTKIPLITRHIVHEMHQTKARVLVAEDNPVNQKVTTLILQKAGFRCDIASNGLEAVEAVSNLSYDIILMDCQMPEMDGFEATHAIRTHEMERIRQLPIIAMTANAMQGDRDRCLEVGMNDYISKPFKREELIALLSRWLPAVDATETSRPIPGSESSASNTQILDLKNILEIADGDMKFLVQLTEQMLNDIPDTMQRMQDALNQKDLQTMAQEAHSIAVQPPLVPTLWRP